MNLVSSLRGVASGGLCIAVLLGTACTKEEAKPRPSPPQSVPDKAITGAAQVNTKERQAGPARSKAMAQGHAASVECLSKDAVKAYDPMGFRLSGSYSVARVAPGDTLALREEPSASSRQIGDIARDVVDVQPLGEVCRVQKAYWWRVAVGEQSGWVNSGYLGRLASPADATKRFSGLAKSPSDATASAFMEHLLKAMAPSSQEEGRFEAELVDLKTSEFGGSATVYACCAADDSVVGEQVEIELSRDEKGWAIKEAKSRALCARGLSSDRQLCL